jgi:hypothetical protein
MQERGFFPLIWHLRMSGHLKFVYEVGTMWSQTKVHIAKSSCEFCALLRYYVVQTDNSLLTFQDNPSVPSSQAEKSKGENTA